MNNFLSVKELSGILNFKEATLYALVAHKEIPHYKIGKLIRFRKEEIDLWIEGKKVFPGSSAHRIPDFKNIKSFKTDLDLIVKNAIEESKRKEYNFNHGKPDKFKPLRKGGNNGGI